MHLHGHCWLMRQLRYISNFSSHGVMHIINSCTWVFYGAVALIYLVLAFTVFHRIYVRVTEGYFYHSAPVLWSHIGALTHRLAEEPSSTAGLLFVFRCPSGTILLTPYSMVWDWWVSRAGPMFLYWPKLLYPYFIPWVAAPAVRWSGILKSHVWRTWYIATRWWIKKSRKKLLIKYIVWYHGWARREIVGEELSLVLDVIEVRRSSTNKVYRQEHMKIAIYVCVNTSKYMK